MKRVLITGVSRGLGLVTAKRLLDTGWNVVAVQRTISPELTELAAVYRDRLRFFSFDLSVTHEIEARFREEWFAKDEPIDGLVNNAAVAYDDIVTNLDFKRLDEMMKVNVTAPMLLAKAAIRRMLLHRNAGSLVHVSSISAHTGFKGLAMYAATKGSIEAFSKGVAREWGSRQIRSNCVVPGFLETEMSGSLDQDQRDRIYRRTSLQAPTSLESVAASIEFLLSEQSGSMTGQNLVVDSGSL